MRYVVGSLLWGSSAYLSILLFLSIAGNQVIRRIFMTVLALTLEGAKILSWRMGKKARLLSFALLSLSAVASFGAALQTVKESEVDFVIASMKIAEKSDYYVAMQHERDSIDEEIAITIDRLRKLPPDYTTAATNLTSSLNVLRNRRTIVQNTIADYEVAGKRTLNEANIFVLISHVIGIAPENVLLIILLFLSACVEAGALLFNGNESSISFESKNRLRPMSYRQPIDPTIFLEAAREGADLPFLHGRDVTAEKLGISSYQAKIIVRQLVESGLVVVEGKRLKLAKSTDFETKETTCR